MAYNIAGDGFTGDGYMPRLAENEIHAACRRFGITVNEFKGIGRKARMVAARRAVAIRLREREWTLHDIMEVLNYTDEEAVRHLLAKPGWIKLPEDRAREGNR